MDSKDVSAQELRDKAEEIKEELANIDVDAPTITSATIGELEALIEGKTIRFNLNADDLYTEGTVAVSEEASAVITYGETVVNLETVNTDSVLQLFKSKVNDENILGSTLIGEKVKVELKDIAGNITTYTIEFLGEEESTDETPAP